MKKSRYFIFFGFLLILVGFVYSAPPSFNIFTGYVFCADSSNYLDSYTMSINASNDVDSFSESSDVSTGQYYFLVSANESYNISFFVEDIFVGKENYSLGIINTINFTLSSDHSLCSDEGGDNNNNNNNNNNKNSKKNSKKNNQTSLCNNNVIDENEECDGNEFGDNTCESLGYDEGTLLCYEDCTFDKSHCINLEDEEPQNNETQFPQEASRLPLFIIMFLIGLVFIVVMGFMIFKKLEERKLENISKGINLK